MSRAKTTPSTIYAIQCEVNGKVYVGCTQDFQKRITTHFRELKKGIKDYRPFYSKERIKTNWQNDYDQYGRDAFKVFILEENVPPAKAYVREDYWLDYYDATNPEYGYNINHGAVTVKFTVEPGLPKCKHHRKEESA